MADDTARRPQDLQGLLDLAVKVIRHEDVWDGLRAPNAEPDGAAPLDLVAAEEQERVVDLLTAMAEGVTS